MSAHWKGYHLYLLCCLFICKFNGAMGARDHIVKTMEINAAKGKFLVHMLHSAYFFPQTVDVKWSASAQGKPNLPVWLHLFQSKHRAISYLIGTPVTPFQQITVHVIAKRLDNYQSAEQLITIVFNDDVRFNSSTKQVAEFKIKNLEAEEFTNTRNDHVKRLERAIHETFRGKGVNPYIFNIMPEIQNPPEEFYRVASQLKIGSIVQVGTQQHFHSNLHRILEGLKKNPQYCHNNNYIPMDKNFRSSFKIDWCKFDIKNVTMIKSLDHANTYSTEIIGQERRIATSVQVDKAESRRVMDEADIFHSNYPPPTNYFWQSILVFPSLAVFCILLILFLSFIFFGRREGQHWRDYTTSKDQLQEYLNVRESQRHLRELSVQRQMLRMSSSDRKSQTPLGINAFLQPKNPSLPPTPVPAHGNNLNPHSRVPSQRNLISSSHPRLPTSASPGPGRRPERRANSSAMDNNRDNEPAGAQHFPYLTPRSSVGKQTVADAARATGSSLHLYRNPLDDEDSEGNDNALLQSNTNQPKYAERSNTLR